MVSIKPIWDDLHFEPLKIVIANIDMNESFIYLETLRPTLGIIRLKSSSLSRVPCHDAASNRIEAYIKNPNISVLFKLLGDHHTTFSENFIVVDKKWFEGSYVIDDLTEIRDR